MEFSTLRQRCSGPVHRRTFLEVGGLSMLGLGLSDFLRFKAAAASGEADPGYVDKDTAVIFVWLPGGLPHMETYDMKPEAPMEYRGDFRPMKTKVPGIEVCELLPRHAKIADKFAIIRSIHHEFADHGGAHKRMMTGRLPKTPTGTINDAPAVSSIVKKVLGAGQKAMDIPICVSEVDGSRSGIDTFAMGSAWLGASNTPFMVAGDPSDPEFKVQNIGVKTEMETRIDDRLTMLEGLDRFRRSVDKSGAMEAMDSFNRQAMEMLMSERVREAFDLSKEDQKTRDRYGMTAYGQRALMARRLVEAGSRFVTVVWENPFPGKPVPKNCAYNWDCHAVNCHIFDDFKWRAPVYDLALTGLIEDLHQRGLDKKVLLVVGSDFGHTPKINAQRGTQTGVMQPGRDHWPNSMSILVSGGGMPMGQVIGATNAKGEHPVERIMTPNDLWATVYQHLGIDYNRYLTNLEGLPTQILPFGKPIPELAAGMA
ncbi:MAG: DUF1501 domain-containing protein [Akkermansiaceae bacterium]|nr:DUF1501 domain-containing protein [Akkermansiaceae bacterium]MCP5549461.1 DUF1501 domain-containing protein [Akkermansiaceae bacterium]